MCTYRGQHWAKLLALPHLILNTSAVGLVVPHSTDGKSEAWGSDKMQGQDLSPGDQTPETLRGPQQPLTPDSLSCACLLPAVSSTRKGDSLKRNHMAQIPSFHRDTQEQDLISQLLLRLQIFTSKYVPICHIFASSSLGVYPHQLGGGEAWLRRDLPSRGADDNLAKIIEGWLVCQSQSPPLLSCCQPKAGWRGGKKGKKEKTTFKPRGGFFLFFLSQTHSAQVS